MPLHGKAGLCVLSGQMSNNSINENIIICNKYFFDVDTGDFLILCPKKLIECILILRFI